MKPAVLSLAAAGAFIAVVPAYAHHSFAATYDEGKTITVDATVTQFLFRNPHALFSADSTDAQGNVVKWEVEWNGAGRLGALGITADTFKPGDHVLLTGSPGKYATDHRLHLKSIVRSSDGLKFDNKQFGGGRYRRY